jgi:hypothetical protein
MTIKKITFTLPKELVRRLEKGSAWKKKSFGQKGCGEGA